MSVDYCTGISWKLLLESKNGEEISQYRFWSDMEWVIYLLYSLNGILGVRGESGTGYGGISVGGWEMLSGLDGVYYTGALRSLLGQYPPPRNPRTQHKFKAQHTWWTCRLAV